MLQWSPKRANKLPSLRDAGSEMIGLGHSQSSPSMARSRTKFTATSDKKLFTATGGFQLLRPPRSVDVRPKKMPFRTIEERYQDMKGNISRNKAMMQDHQETLDWALELQRSNKEKQAQKAADEAWEAAHYEPTLPEFFRSRFGKEAKNQQATTQERPQSVHAIDADNKWQQVFRDTMKSKGDAKAMVSTWRETRAQKAFDVTNSFGSSFEVKL